MRTIIYDARFRINAETTKAMAWISFPNLLPTYFVKEYLFSLASKVGKPFQLHLATINKIRPSCTRKKVLIDLKGKFPKSVLMDIVNEVTGERRTEVISIKYDYLPRYCEDCKMQGHSDGEYKNSSKGNDGNKVEVIDAKEKEEQIVKNHVPKPWVHKFQKGKAKILSSGKVVGDPEPLFQSEVFVDSKWPPSKNFIKIISDANFDCSSSYVISMLSVPTRSHRVAMSLDFIIKRVPQFDRVAPIPQFPVVIFQRHGAIAPRRARGPSSDAQVPDRA
ncbi:hypothetical protein FXO37_32491 [Capsicum annuum]|nr:hypothetical protein FXO37_32491 [Capsicum annuum]